MHSMPTICASCSMKPITSSNYTPGNSPVFVAVASDADNKASVTLSIEYPGIMDIVLLSAYSDSLQWWIDLKNEAQLGTIYINTNKQSIRGFANVGDSSVPFPQVIIDPSLPAVPSSQDNIDKYLQFKYGLSVTSYAGCDVAKTFQIASDADQCDASNVHPHQILSKQMVCGSATIDNRVQTQSLWNPLIQNNVIDPEPDYSMFILSGYNTQGSVVSVDLSDQIEESLILALATYHKGTVWKIDIPQNVHVHSIYVCTQIDPRNIHFVNNNGDDIPIVSVEVYEIASQYQSGAFSVINDFENATGINYTSLFVTNPLDQIYIYSKHESCPLIKFNWIPIVASTVGIIPICACIGCAIFVYCYRRRRKRREKLKLQEMYKGPGTPVYDSSGVQQDGQQPESISSSSSSSSQEHYRPIHSREQFHSHPPPPHLSSHVQHDPQLPPDRSNVGWQPFYDSVVDVADHDHDDNNNNDVEVQPHEPRLPRTVGPQNRYFLDDLDLTDDDEGDYDEHEDEDAVIVGDNYNAAEHNTMRHGGNYFGLGRFRTLSSNNDYGGIESLHYNNNNNNLDNNNNTQTSLRVNLYNFEGDEEDEEDDDMDNREARGNQGGYDDSIIMHQTPKYRDYPNPYI